MPKKPRKPHKHSHHRHSSKTKRHHRKRASENVLDPIKEVSKEKTHIDSRACGDCIKPAADKRPSQHNIEKKSNNQAIRHHSLEKDTNSLLSKTRKLFRREKSFNDHLDKKKRGVSVKKPKNKEKEKENIKYHEHKKKQGKSFGNVQEVIFCQVHQTPFTIKNDKNTSEIKDLYRRRKKDKNNNSKHEDEKKINPVEQESSYHSHRTARPHEHIHKQHKRHHHDHVEEAELNDNKKNHVKDERTSSGPYEKFFAKNHPNGKHKTDTDDKPNKKNQTSSNERNKVYKDVPKHTPQLEEDQIKKIVEGNMKNYFTKFQTVIDKKLDGFMQFNKKSEERNEKNKGKKEHESKKHDHKKKESQIKNDEEQKYKDEIIKEVLKRIKDEGRESRRRKSDRLTENHKKNISSVLEREGVQHLPTEEPLKQRRLHRSPHTNSTMINDYVVNGHQFNKHYISPLDCRSCSEQQLGRFPEPSASANKKTSSTAYEKQRAHREISALMHHIKENRKKSITKRTSNDLVMFSDPFYHQPQCVHDQHPLCYQKVTNFTSEKSKFLNRVTKSDEKTESIVIQCIEPPSLENSKTQKMRVKRLECKTVSIISIPPQVEASKHLPHQTLTTRSNKQPNMENDLVERRKHSRRFRLYYKYSVRQQAKDESKHSSSDGKSIISDSCKNVLDPFETPNPGKADVTTDIMLRKNNTWSKPMQVRECYFKPLTSSHSEYCLETRKYETHLQSRFRIHQTNHSNDEAKPTSAVKRSKSDLVLDMVFAKSRKMQTKCNKKCQTSNFTVDESNMLYVERKEDFKEIYKTLDHLEINLQKCGLSYPELRNVGVGPASPKNNVEDQTHDIIITIDNLKDGVVMNDEDKEVERVDVGIGSGNIIDIGSKKKTREVAVETLPGSWVRNSNKNKILKSTGVSPIRIIEDKELIKRRPEEHISKKAHTPKSSPAKITQKTFKSATSSSPFRKTTLQPIHNTPFSFQNVVNPQVVLVQDQYDFTPRNTKPPSQKQEGNYTADKESRVNSKPASRICKRNNSSSKDRPRSGISDNSRKPNMTNKNRTEPEKLYVLPSIESDSNSTPIHKTICDLHTVKKLKAKLEDGSTSSSVSDALDQNPRRSQSLTQIKPKKNDENRSKSTVCCFKQKENDRYSRGGSFISSNLEKFTNRPTLRSPSVKSNTDQCVENKLAGRLFLTKNYKGGEVSAYQRRKLYDQSIRKRMKRKFKLSKMNVGPQVFEVRFLSMMEPRSAQGDNTIEKQVFSFNLDGLKPTLTKTSGEEKKIKEIIDTISTNADLGMDIEKLTPPIDSTKLDDKTKSETNQKLFDMCQKLLSIHKNFDMQQLEDVLYKLMMSYRKSASNSKPNWDQNVEAKKNLPTDGLEEVFPGQFSCSRSFSCQSFDISDEADRIISMSQPVSCPVLMSNTTSFEFLYEETSSTENRPKSKEMIFRNLTRPFDQTFHFNMNQYNVETPFIPGSKYYVPSSVTESGYSSVKSKENSTSNFFKKPNILALLKPGRSTKCSDKKEENELYKKMSQTCQQYARKVIENSESKGKLKEHVYEEFPLKLMLWKDETLPDTETLSELNAENNILANGCKLIITNDTLKLETVFYLMGDLFKDVNIRDSKSFQKRSDMDGFSSRSEQGLGLNRTESSTTSVVKSFVTALLESYDREMDVFRRLLNDNEFLQNVLVPAAEQKIKETKRCKGGKLRGLFTRARCEDEMKKEKAMSPEEMQTTKKLQQFARHAKKDFTMLAQAVRINENLDDIKICGILKLLECIDSGDFTIEQVHLHFDFTSEMENHIRETFAGAFVICEKETRKLKKNLSATHIDLIRLLVTRYRISLLVKTDAVPLYIGRGRIQTESQLKAAVSYVVRTAEDEINTDDLENSIKTAKENVFN